ncbi:hypothetical protein IAE39_001150 [Pseudomonas sp. S37]|uniref:hypothetical protein n=1 Tax=Pseudomonas sp. S37 TaxID=2767449 RepID=UPI001911B6B3|nr:hypothetical protein [Pseudomonas sp. S37]MBK4992976.1 hypothetical protein [Pseudomonas sp. S37]
MGIPVEVATRDALIFLKGLCEAELITWPIDYEFVEHSDEQLAETFGDWFGGTRWSECGDCFVHFGRDGSGSLFLLWYYPELISQPPVVFMGSEGECGLVADNIQDFIRQMGSGKVFFDNAWITPEDEDNMVINWAGLACAIEQQYGSNHVTPEQLLDKAKRNHVDFAQWVESKVEYT